MCHKVQGAALCVFVPAHISASLGMLFSMVPVSHTTGLHTCTWALHTAAIIVQWAAGGAGKLQARTHSILMLVLLSISVYTAAVSQHQLGKQQVAQPQ